MPGKAPLDLPPGEPAAVDDLVAGTTAAASRLALIADGLTGPAAAAPGWLGVDATAATTQLARVAAIARSAADAVLAATDRLGVHGELLRDARREVEALRDEQDEDFRAAWQRLSAVDDPQLAVMTGSPAWTGVVAEVEAAEARRRRRHRLLLQELEDDAAATARALAEASRPVGGTGRAGDGERVLAHLAVQLPGWGDPEMAARGRALADALLGSDERARLSGAAVHLAAHPAFASALVRELGAERFGLLLDVLGQDPDGPDQPLAAVLAAALGAAVPSGRPGDRVAAVLGATYVRPDDRYGADATAAGMAAVLSAGLRSAAGGPRPETVGSWARQLLLREQAQDLPAGLAHPGGSWREDASDPVQLAVGVLARGGDPAAASALLGDERVWQALLDRAWGDGGTALGELVEEAGRDPGAAGDRAVRLGLGAIGAGLVEGDPSARTVDRDVVEAVSPALAAAASAHVDVVADGLASLASEAGGPEGTDDVLKGLGYVTVDRRAAATVEQALTAWAAEQSRDLAGSSRAEPLPAVAVPAAYLAVQEHGQRLTHALDGFELQDEAQDRKAAWDWTAGLLLEVVSHVPAKPIAVLAEVVGAYAPILLDVDGTFDQGPDRGLRFGPDLAGATALATLPPELAPRAATVEAQAEASYRRVADRLGDPEAPRSAPEDWGGATLELVTGVTADVVTDDARDRAERGRVRFPSGGFLPGRR